MSWLSNRVPNLISKTWRFSWTGHKEPEKKESELFKNRLKDQEVTPRAEEAGLNGDKG